MSARWRQVAGVAVDMRLEVEPLSCPGDRGVPPLAREAIDAREEFEVLAHGQIAIERKFLSHVTKMLSRFAGAGFEIDIRDQGLAGSRL